MGKKKRRMFSPKFKAFRDRLKKPEPVAKEAKEVVEPKAEPKVEPEVEQQDPVTEKPAKPVQEKKPPARRRRRTSKTKTDT